MYSTMYPKFALSTPDPPADTTRNIPPPPTPIILPRSILNSHQNISKQALVGYLQTIRRPGDLSIAHLEALSLHVSQDTDPKCLLPDPSFLPPREEWTSIPASELANRNEGTKRPLNNGAKSPGAATYVERLGELSISNDAAFRTVRRVPPSPGHPLVRLGNAYEFFKNLEMLTNYWDDTSVSHTGPEASDAMDVDTDTKAETQNVETTNNQARLFVRTGTGSSMSNDMRQNLLISFVKLVSYDFGCNVTVPRLEPRLHLKSHGPNPLHSYFPSTPIFVCRTPVSRKDARAGIVEGPVVALSPRQTTSFHTAVSGPDTDVNGVSKSIPLQMTDEEIADLSREVINILTTAQLRSREHQTEIPYGDGKWWCTKPRWGGGVGGPIGREIKEPGPEAEKEKEKVKEEAKGEIIASFTEPVKASGSTTLTTTMVKVPSASEPAAVTGQSSMISSSEKPERKKQKLRKKKGQMEIYDGYRMVRPPATNWDSKSRYMAIGKDPQSPFDEIFLISALFHHISIVRARVSIAFLEGLEGRGKFMSQEEDADEGEEGKLVLWRSKWYDLFNVEERVEAMGLVWGVMGYLMRVVEEEKKEVVKVDAKDGTCAE